ACSATVLETPHNARRWRGGPTSGSRLRTVIETATTPARLGGVLLCLLRGRFPSRHVLRPELLGRRFRGRRYRRAVLYSRAPPASARCFLAGCCFAAGCLAGRHLATSCFSAGG